MATPRPRDQAALDAERAYQMSLRGADKVQIAAALHVSLRTVGSYLQKQRALVWNETSPEDRAAWCAEFEAQQRAVMAEAWRRLGTMKDQSLNVSGLLNAILTASKNIATARGLFVVRHARTDTEGNDIDLDKVIEVHYHRLSA